ncbi:VIT1/CCC1 transporter family protein [Candidatus Bathyarchaeota archaeon]|nr:VIT1/CCC1 transporter family protein [Candidatus Bathyarchaeota archaeon]
MIERIKLSILTAIQTTKKWIKDFDKFKEITDLDEIARRYFVINAFDGSMTMLGIISGVLFSNITDYRIIINSGLGACIAMGVSGTYMSEKAERTRDLRELEDAMLTNLENSIISEASHFAAVFIALIDGVSPVIAGLVPLIPFFFARSGLLHFSLAVRASIALNLLTLFILGAFLGKVSGEGVLRKGIIMMTAGLTAAVLSVLLSTLI